MSECNEEWVEISEKDFTLMVSRSGEVKNVTGKIMSQYLGKNGYFEISPKQNGKRKKFTVHRLIGKAFCPGYFEGATIDHVNGIKTDNRPENLEWVSLSENSKREWQIGLVDLNGENQPTHILTKEQVRCIRKLLSIGISRNILSVIAGVDYKTIDKIHKGITWKKEYLDYE